LLRGVGIGWRRYGVIILLREFVDSSPHTTYFVVRPTFEKNILVNSITHCHTTIINFLVSFLFFRVAFYAFWRLLYLKIFYFFGFFPLLFSSLGCLTTQSTLHSLTQPTLHRQPAPHRHRLTRTGKLSLCISSFDSVWA